MSTETPAPGTTRQQLRVAAIQATPAYLDRDATIHVVVEEIAKAAADGVDLVVFPESFLPGYPDWLWRSRPWRDGAWYERFAREAVDIDSGVLNPICKAAADANLWVALGVTERANGSLYNTVVYIDRDGHVIDRHRKLVPTGAERLVWANGQDSILRVVDIDGVRVGSLICWENYMPLARVAMYQQGIDVLLAPTWDNSDQWLPTLRHIAKEGGVFVVGVTCHLVGSDIPRDLPDADTIYGGDDDPLSAGNTTIVAPGGQITAGPLHDMAGTVTAELDLTLIASQRRQFDPVGHYARPDVLTLTVHNS